MPFLIYVFPLQNQNMVDLATHSQTNKHRLGRKEQKSVVQSE